MTGADIVAEARTWIGVPFRHQGRSRDGVDCIGLPVCVRAALGIETKFAGVDYGRTAKDEAMLAYCRSNMVEVRFSELQEGDLLIIAFGVNRHMAIVCKYPLADEVLGVIHSMAETKKGVVEQRMDPRWTRFVRGCFRFREVVA